MISFGSRAWITGCTLAASALTLASCTSSSHDTHASDRPSPTAGRSRPATGPSEQQLTERAQEALASVHTGHMLESGTERVSDGVHTEPNVKPGKTYKLSLVCFGSGSARLSFSPAGTGSQAELPCDRSVVQQRITARKQRLHVDVDGSKGSSGVIAWQIDSV